MSAPPELKCRASWLRLPPTLLHWASRGGNSGQGFFAAACNDDRFLDLDVVDGAADKSGEGEIQEFASEFQ